MTINGGIFVLQQVYNKQVSKTWFDTLYNRPQNSYGWFVGGIVSATISASQRINFSADTLAMANRGPLTIPTRALGGSGNINYGWFSGGISISSPSVPETFTTTIHRITYITDSSSASVRGTLASTQFLGASTSTNIYGRFSGGRFDGPSPSVSSRTHRISFNDDTNTTSIRGSLSLAREGVSGVGTDNYGWFGGGFALFLPSSYNRYSRIDRIDYATDTSVTSIRGNLTSNKSYPGSIGNDNNGWFAGGSVPAPGPSSSFVYISTIDRTNFADDTTTASTRGPLSSIRAIMAATGNNNDGWFDGGVNTSPGRNSRLDRITFSNDTNTTSVRLNSSFERNSHAGTSGII
jgi:hypothetical protein